MRIGMSLRKAARGRWPVAVAVLATMAAAGSIGAQTPSAPSARVEIEQYQVAFIGSGNLGGGTLFYNGKTYPFSIGGLGIGGFGVSKIEATGEVHNLKNVADFAGAYGQARAGAVAADMSTGSLWLQNTAGVAMKLDAKRQGLALSLGADAIVIQMK